MIDPKLQPVAYIQQVVAREFKLPRRVMSASYRGVWAESHARQAAYFVARLLMPWSTSRLAKRFNRDPKTFTHGVMRTWGRIQTDDIMRRRVTAAVEKLRVVLCPENIGDTPCINQMMSAKEMGCPVVEAEQPTLADWSSQ